MAVKHVVLFKLRNEVTESRAAQAFATLRALKEKIPTITSFEGGTNVSEEGLSDGLTHAFVMTMADRQAVREYLDHPEHVKLVDELLPILEKLVVFDFVV